MALRRAGGILGHDLLEEVGDVISASVLRVPHVLAVIVASLERVILHREIRSNVTSSKPVSRKCRPEWFACRGWVASLSGDRRWGTPSRRPNAISA